MTATVPSRARASARLFGGLVAAQAVIAAGRSVVEAPRSHSLHAYFLRAGAARTRRSASRSSARATAAASRRAASWSRCRRAGRSSTWRRASRASTSGVAARGPHAESSRTRGARASGRTCARRVRRATRGRGASSKRSTCACSSPSATRRARAPRPTRAAWMRLRGEPPADPLLRTALLVYASDRTLLRAAARPARHALDASAAREPRPRALAAPRRPRSRTGCSTTAAARRRAPAAGSCSARVYERASAWRAWRRKGSSSVTRLWSVPLRADPNAWVKREDAMAVLARSPPRSSRCCLRRSRSGGHDALQPGARGPPAADRRVRAPSGRRRCSTR